MGMRRLLLAPIAVAVLGLVGTACQPAKPQMVLTLEVSPSGTFEVLTNVITLNVRVKCTRPARVQLRADFVLTETPDGAFLVQLVSARTGALEQTVTCDGLAAAPNGSERTTVWRVHPAQPYAQPPPNPLPVTMTGKTETGVVTPPIDYDVEVVSETVTLTRILCWWGTSGCFPV
jgi:hypothetical protein